MSSHFETTSSLRCWVCKKQFRPGERYTAVLYNVESVDDDWSIRAHLASTLLAMCQEHAPSEAQMRAAVARLVSSRAPLHHRP